MKIGHVEIFVSDPMKSMEFYSEFLGFEVTNVQSDKFVWLKNGDLEFLLRPGASNTTAQDYTETKTGFVLYTDDLNETRSNLEEKGSEFLGTDGSEKCLTFTDPDGNWFQLVNPNDH